MSDQNKPEFRTLLQVNGNYTDAAVTEFAIEHLREKGYLVELPHKWETPAKYCRRIGVKLPHFYRQVRHPARPHVDLELGPTGRLKFIASNSLFDDFVRRNLPSSISS